MEDPRGTHESFSFWEGEINEIFWVNRVQAWVRGKMGGDGDGNLRDPDR